MRVVTPLQGGGLQAVAGPPPEIRMRRKGFTLLEVLTVLAFLIILLGLMVSLARYVRTQSASQYTRHLLAELDQARRLYASAIDGTFLSPALIEGVPPHADEQQVAEYVTQTGAPYVSKLLEQLRPTQTQAVVRDAWGNPVGYLPHQDARFGMALRNEPFFFSAGPDGKFLTRQDNLYSYEQLNQIVNPDLPTPVGSGSVSNNAATRIAPESKQPAEDRK